MSAFLIVTTRQRTKGKGREARRKVSLPLSFRITKNYF